MTFSAVDGPVFTLKRKVGPAMIKGLLSIFEIDQLKVAAMVFDMAHLTLIVIDSAVEPLARLALFLNRRMADQTVLSQCRAVFAVALLTVFDAFEKGMALVQFAGRYLCGSTERRHYQEE